MLTLSKPIQPSPATPSSRLAAMQLNLRLETRLFAGCCALMLVLRLIYAHSLRVDSDEPQHLHVVWGWANGLLQYRDLFDNHTPLFQMLMGPVFRMFGEHAGILFPMRLVMLPLFALTVWCLFKIGEALFSYWLACWIAITGAFMPRFFLTSTEFRTDDLWVLFWFATLAILVAGPFTPLRAWGAGFTIGLSFATSLKTSLSLATLLLAAGCVLVFQLVAREKINWRQLGVSVLCCLGGLIIVPGAIVLFFARAGAFQSLYYCTITHNTVFGLGGRNPGEQMLRFPIAAPLLVAGAALMFWGTRDKRQRPLRALIFLGGSFYVFALRSYWPLITPQDYLPFDPLVCVFAIPAIFALSRLCKTRSGSVSVARIAIPAFLLTEFATMMYMHSPLHDSSMQAQKLMVADVLRLTKPSEFVMDGKGETIYRSRPFYWVLESVAMVRMNRGLIKDDLVQRLIDTRTAVIHYVRIPSGSQLFVKQNYLPVGEVYVLGKMLDSSAAAPNSYGFDIAIPARYSVMSDAAMPPMFLDGKPMVGSSTLVPGHHVLSMTEPHGRLALLWATAQEKGYTPFKKQWKKSETSKG